MRWRRRLHKKRGVLVIAKRKETPAVQQFWFGLETARDSGYWSLTLAARAPQHRPQHRLDSHCKIRRSRL
jgi:hypothetical protein